MAHGLQCVLSMKTRKLAALVAMSLLPLASACSGGAYEDASSSSSAIVNGSVSTASQDATVLLNLGEGLCTGTLIAPNLVLTARHCVSEIGGNSACGTFSTDAAPGTISVSLGASAGQNSPSVAKGVKLFHETNNSGCSYDLALVQLDKDIQNAKIAPVRFTALVKGELTVAVGYGETGQGALPASRMQRSGIKIDAVGPASYTYQAKDGTSLPVTVPPGEIATGESTCFGDSGGPLFDAQGNVVGATSRGIDDSCVDRPSIFSDTRSHEALIRQAATAAGYPLGVVSGTPQTDGGTDSRGDAGKGRTDAGKSSSSSGDEDSDYPDDTNDESGSRGVPRASAGAGCSASPDTASGMRASDVLAIGLVLASALGLRARRRRVSAG
jgi:V8-like Glu-specific endopeptidase